MSRSFFLGTRLGMQSLQVFGFIWLFDKVSAELVWDISRSARFLCYQRKKELIFWARPGFKLTHLCDPSDHRRPYVAGFAPLLSKVTWNVKNSYKLCMRYWISWWLLGFFLFIILARNIDCKSILQKTLNKFGLVASKYERKSRYKSNFQCVSLCRCVCFNMSRHMFLQSAFQFGFLSSKPSLFPLESSLEFVIHRGKPKFISLPVKFPADRSKFQFCTMAQSKLIIIFTLTSLLWSHF